MLCCRDLHHFASLMRVCFMFWRRRTMKTQQRPRPMFLLNVCLFLLLVVAVTVLVVPALTWVNYRNPYILHTLSSQSEHFHSWLANGSLEDLQAGYPAVTVHYLWCHKKHFEFKHYVSILSIVKMLQPDQVVFHYADLPLVDSTAYPASFQDIQRDITFLTLQKDSNSDVCGDVDSQPRLTGIIIREDVAVINFSRVDFYKLARYSQSRSNFLVYLSPASASLSNRVKSEGGVVVPCASVQYFNEAPPKDKISCVHINNNLSLNDTWTRNEKIYRFAKDLVYGSKSIQPKSHNGLVPLDCHILHFMDSNVSDYLALLSVISALKVGRVNHVYLHSDRLQSGSLFNDVMKNRNVTFVPVPHIRNFHPTSADVTYGAYVLLRHGGVVVSSDTIWRKSFPKDLQLYDSSVSSTSSKSNGSIFDLSVLFSRANSEFLKLLISTLRQPPSKTFQSGIEEVAYKVYIERPGSVNIHANLIQHVTCSTMPKICQPTSTEKDSIGSVFIKVSWNGENPLSKSDIKQYQWRGASFPEALIKYTN